MTVTNQIIKVQDTQYIVNYCNVSRIAKFISRNYLHKRGRFVDPNDVAVVLACMAYRRCQPTNSTNSARGFDEVVASVGGAVPAVLNQAVATIPLNGMQKVNQITAKVVTTGIDTAVLDDYITSGRLLSALNNIKSFAQANDIILVPISVCAFIQPSILFQTSDLDTNVQTTLPKEIIKKKEVCTLTEEEIKHGIDSQLDQTLKGKAKQQEIERIKTEIVDNHTDVKPEYPSWEPGDSIISDDLCAASMSPDSVLRTPSQAGSYLFPLLEVVPQIETLTPGTSHICAKIFTRFEDLQEWDAFIEHSMHILMLQTIKDQVKIGDQTMGSADTRVRTPVPVPSLGASPDQGVKVAVHEQDIQQQYYKVTNQPFVEYGNQQARQQSAERPQQQGNVLWQNKAKERLNRPTFTPRRGAGRGPRDISSGYLPHKLIETIVNHVVSQLRYRM